ncbi:MAG TPA: hypothetical protein VHH35_06015 [Pyrinomonadaceae bacterium]|nr:hypothetical protein [Pyrinomonadaceae bacterium]
MSFRIGYEPFRIGYEPFRVGYEFFASATPPDVRRGYASPFG